MKTKEQRYNELYSSGLVSSIKQLFGNRTDISEDYYVLMADYIDSMNEIKDQMLINPTEIARRMPELVKSIKDTNLGGIYGRTDNNRIQIEQSLNYNDKKLYFFHELTHALQTSTTENGREQCGFYNGHDGMFLTEGSTQYTAEILFNISNGTIMEHRQQARIVRGATDRTPYSPLSEYQYNGDILELLSKTMDLPLPQVLALAYKKNGRDTLKAIYESMEGNQGKFDELMNNLEQIYSIDNLLIHGYGQQLQSQPPLNITMQDGETRFQWNIISYRQLMDKTERELVACYMENHDEQYILQNYKEIASLLTTNELKKNFLSAIHELNQLVEQNDRENMVNIDNYVRTNQQPTQSVQMEMPEGFSINEFGEIIRPGRTEQVQTNLQQQNQNKLSLKQRVAQFLQRNNLFMNLSFIENFVHQQLDVLPPPVQETRSNTSNSSRTGFENWITNNGQLRNLPPIQRMSDPQKSEEMRRKIEGRKSDDGLTK